MIWMIVCAVLAAAGLILIVWALLGWCVLPPRREAVTIYTVTASPHACSMGGSQIWLKEGERLTVDEMLKAVCVVSANDCAVALAEHLAAQYACVEYRPCAGCRE
mgnify:CR=1 FL=1